MQTILGAGGAIGNELALSLNDFTKDIRLVSRNPRKINETDHLLKADLLNKDDVDKAIEGSSVVYVTIGFPYSYKIWKSNWPVLIDNVLKSCKKFDAKLVFFDNVYMYDSNCIGFMTEDCPVNPPSKKGIVRAQIAKTILDAVEKGNVKALIARSADFYGPGIEKTSVLTETVIKPLLNGKTANWLSADKFKHSFTYTKDAAKATALLGNTDGAYNQVWHLPTAANPLTVKEWVEAIAAEIGKPPSCRTAPKFIVRLLGLFDPVMRELVEMIYQYDRDYNFNSSKFENHFSFTPTPYSEGIKETVRFEIAHKN